MQVALIQMRFSSQYVSLRKEKGKTGLNLITAAPKIFNPKKFCCYVNCLVCVLLCVVFVCFVLMDPESGNKAERIQKSPSEI